MKESFLYVIPISLLCSATSLAVLELGITIHNMKNCPRLCSYPCYWGIEYDRFPDYPSDWHNQEQYRERCRGTIIKPLPPPQDPRSRPLHQECKCYCGGRVVPNEELQKKEEDCVRELGIVSTGFQLRNGTDETYSYNMNRIYGYFIGTSPGLIGIYIVFASIFGGQESWFKFVCLTYSYLCTLLEFIYLFVLIPIQHQKGQLHIQDVNICPLESDADNEYLCRQYNTAILVNIIFHCIATGFIAIYSLFGTDIGTFVLKKIGKGLSYGTYFILCIPLCSLLLQINEKKEKNKKEERKMIPMNINPNSFIYPWHGTGYESAKSIKKNGFTVSIDGLLGKGVYVSRDITKAMEFAKNKPKPTLLKLKVRNGKMININDHPEYQKSWHSKFDIAYIPANSITRREEYCIKDPKMITIEEIIENPPESFIQEQYEKYRTSHSVIV